MNSPDHGRRELGGRTITADVQNCIADIVQRIQDSSASPELDRELRLLASQHGRWVYDAVVDKLTSGGDTYGQGLQDWLSKTVQVQIAANGETLPVIYDGLLTQDEQIAFDQIMDLLNQIIPVDFHSICRAAKLSRLQADVWNYFLRGYTPQAMSCWMRKPDQARYTSKHLREVLVATLRKVWECPAIAWRTCMAEDIARGRFAVPPQYISWMRIVQD